MDPAAAKQQIAERVKQASRFLVTVNSNPTVDQLAACIGLTLMLNKMGKHATAVFSGKVPSTIGFLQPEKTLETNADSLRDFIISLDKNKADKLRYKVEDDVVRIFITPYRTSLSEKDFVFSEGDFNVEVVMALGVTQRSQLDAAISAHGRILHDATVVSISVDSKAGDLGQVNWQDPQASSLSEMLVSISEAFGPGLIDSQSATAFLTGIVAETQRFSNQKTTPKVMTMSAQLMAAGANQQLIVSKLEPPPSAPPQKPAPPPKPPEPKKPKDPLRPEGIIDVPREENKKGKTNIELGTTEIHIDEQGNLSSTPDKPQTLEPPELSPSLPAEPEIPAPQPAMPQPTAARAESPPASQEPANRHAFMSPAGQPEWAAPYDLVPMDPMMDDDSTSTGPGSNSVNSQSQPAILSQGHDVQPPVEPSPVNSTVDSARGAVESALASVPFDPAFSPPVEGLNAQPVTGSIHDEPPAPERPIAAQNDTPSLVLPADSQGPVGATLPPPPADLMPSAPPPVPPPLMTAPGAILPPPPPSQI